MIMPKSDGLRIAAVSLAVIKLPGALQQPLNPTQITAEQFIVMAGAPSTSGF
jgi:hypothetical protein